MTVEKQREKLALWLREWEIEKKLRAIDGTEAVPELSGTVPPKVGACVKPKPGDVILLPPSGETSYSRPVYMLLVKKNWFGGWQAVPFSRFTVPATDGELATGREYIPLKVLSLWNYGRLDDAYVKRSWLVASASAADVKLAEEYIAGRRRELPDSRTGAPIVRSFDPRREYLDEERAIWFDFKSSDAEDVFCCGEDPRFDSELNAAEKEESNLPPEEP